MESSDRFRKCIEKANLKSQAGSSKKRKISPPVGATAGAGEQNILAADVSSVKSADVPPVGATACAGEQNDLAADVSLEGSLVNSPVRKSIELPHRNRW